MRLREEEIQQFMLTCIIIQVCCGDMTRMHILGCVLHCGVELQTFDLYVYCIPMEY